MLKEEGLTIDLEDFEPTLVRGKVRVVEKDINYVVSLQDQKIGFSVDEHDNWLLMHSISKARTVLDVCCYSGGFALNATFRGVLHVTGIGSSLILDFRHLWFISFDLLIGEPTIKTIFINVSNPNRDPSSGLLEC